MSNNWQPHMIYQLLYLKYQQLLHRTLGQRGRNSHKRTVLFTSRQILYPNGSNGFHLSQLIKRWNHTGLVITQTYRRPAMQVSASWAKQFYSKQVDLPVLWRHAYSLLRRPCLSCMPECCFKDQQTAKNWDYPWRLREKQCSIGKHGAHQHRRIVVV